MDQDWYEEEQLYSHVIQALYGTIVRFLVNDKHGLSLAKRRKELENTKSLDQGTIILHLFPRTIDLTGYIMHSSVSAGVSFSLARDPSRHDPACEYIFPS